MHASLFSPALCLASLLTAVLCKTASPSSTRGCVYLCPPMDLSVKPPAPVLPHVFKTTQMTSHDVNGCSTGRMLQALAGPLQCSPTCLFHSHGLPLPNSHRMFDTPFAIDSLTVASGGVCPTLALTIDPSRAMNASSFARLQGYSVATIPCNIQSPHTYIHCECAGLQRLHTTGQRALMWSA